MKSDRIVDIFRDGNIVIPKYLIKNYSKFNINLDNFVFLMYLYSLGNNIIFDTKKFSEDLNVDTKKVLEYIGILSDKKLINVEVVSNDKGIKEDVISLNGFYNKIKSFVVEDVTKDDKADSNIFSEIENEFGRTLSPTEYEIIKAWLDNNINEDVIREALKEAAFSGVSNLRYIDKILFEWDKLGIKSKEDVDKNRKKHRKNDKEVDIDLDIVDWNWFDDEGED